LGNVGKWSWLGNVEMSGGTEVLHSFSFRVNVPHPLAKYAFESIHYQLLESSPVDLFCRLNELLTCKALEECEKLLSIFMYDASSASKMFDVHFSAVSTNYLHVKLWKNTYM